MRFWMRRGKWLACSIGREDCVRGTRCAPHAPLHAPLHAPHVPARHAHPGRPCPAPAPVPRRIEAGPVATLHLPHALPYGLHGAWVPEYLGPDPRDPAVPHWVEPNRIREL